MRWITIGILLICSSGDSIQTGRVINTRFTSVDQLNIGSIWLFNLTTWSQCVCDVLSGRFASTAVALNMYRNGSCQFFTTLPYTFTLETNPNSTLVLLKPLPPRDLAPCCSNVSWLINQINASQQESTNVSNPGYVIIDDNNYLVVLSYRVSFSQYNRTTLNMIRNITSVVSPTSLTYRNGFYYIRKFNSFSSSSLGIHSLPHLYWYFCHKKVLQNASIKLLFHFICWKPILITFKCWLMHSLEVPSNEFIHIF